MADVDDLQKLRPVIRAPRAAALAGIAFSLIIGTVMVLIRLATPSDPDKASSWVGDSTRLGQVQVALALVPFAGIAFLWFIGVIRDRLGPREDRFFATVFLGSGMLFLALLFASGAIAASLVWLAEEATPPAEVWQFGRRIVNELMGSYGLRMAAVFVMSASTLAGRLGLLRPWLVRVGFLTALSLLIFAGLVPGMELLFPLWVLLVSIHILLTSNGQEASEDEEP